MKIGHLWVKFWPWRRHVGKNLKILPGKEIYRRFRISNQIFRSIYGSRDIERSLDTTLPVFGQNWHFVDEYLENGAKFGHAVFASRSVIISTTFWSIFTKISILLFFWQFLTCHFDHIFVLYGWTGFFPENPALLGRPTNRYLTPCKKSEKSLEPFCLTFCDRLTN